MKFENPGTPTPPIEQVPLAPKHIDNPSPDIETPPLDLTREAAIGQPDSPGIQTPEPIDLMASKPSHAEAPADHHVMPGLDLGGDRTEPESDDPALPLDLSTSQVDVAALAADKMIGSEGTPHEVTVSTVHEERVATPAEVDGSDSAPDEDLSSDKIEPHEPDISLQKQGDEPAPAQGRAGGDVPPTVPPTGTSAAAAEEPEGNPATFWDIVGGAGLGEAPVDGSDIAPIERSAALPDAPTADETSQWMDRYHASDPRGDEAATPTEPDDPTSDAEPTIGPASDELLSPDDSAGDALPDGERPSLDGKGDTAEEVLTDGIRGASDGEANIAGGTDGLTPPAENSDAVAGDRPESPIAGNPDELDLGDSTQERAASLADFPDMPQDPAALSPQERAQIIKSLPDGDFIEGVTLWDREWYNRDGSPVTDAQWEQRSRAATRPAPDDVNSKEHGRDSSSQKGVYTDTREASNGEAGGTGEIGEGSDAQAVSPSDFPDMPQDIRELSGEERAQIINPEEYRPTPGVDLSSQEGPDVGKYVTGLRPTIREVVDRFYGDQQDRPEGTNKPGRGDAPVEMSPKPKPGKHREVDDSTGARASETAKEVGKGLAVLVLGGLGVVAPSALVQKYEAKNPAPVPAQNHSAAKRYIMKLFGLEKYRVNYTSDNNRNGKVEVWVKAGADASKRAEQKVEKLSWGSLPTRLKVAWNRN